MAFLAGLCAPSAFALDYDVELDVVDAARPLLEQHLELFRWRGEERVDLDLLKRLVKNAPARIKGLLETEGFYRPVTRAELLRDNDRWHVKLHVRRGKSIRVANIDLQFVGAVATDPQRRAWLDEIRSAWPLPVGKRFRHARWEDAKREALSRLLADYPAAKIADSRAAIDTEKRHAGLSVTFDSGPEFTVGPLRIKGLHRYPTQLVERWNPLTRGERYSQSRIRDFQRLLGNSPYFASSFVRIDADPAHPLEAPLQVDIVERPAQMLSFGLGFSTDTGLRAQGDHRHLNLFDSAWRLQSLVRYETKRQTAGVDLQRPITSSRFRDGLDFQLQRTDIEDQITTKASTGLKRLWAVGKHEHALGVRALLEEQTIAGASDQNNRAVVGSYSWLLRNVDDPLSPNRGYVVNLQVGGAAAALGSDQDFGRMYARLIRYWRVLEHTSLIVRGEFGAVLAARRQGIPTDYLFRAGGNQSVRGYAFQSLGLPVGNAIVPARFLAVASAEVVQWVTADWGAALFWDIGDAVDEPARIKPASGLGIGARWKSPVGPLNLDVAYGTRTQELQLHFSVGIWF